MIQLQIIPFSIALIMFKGEQYDLDFIVLLRTVQLRHRSTLWKLALEG